MSWDRVIPGSPPGLWYVWDNRDRNDAMFGFTIEDRKKHRAPQTWQTCRVSISPKWIDRAMVQLYIFQTETMYIYIYAVTIHSYVRMKESNRYVPIWNTSRFQASICTPISLMFLFFRWETNFLHQMGRRLGNKVELLRCEKDLVEAAVELGRGTQNSKSCDVWRGRFVKILEGIFSSNQSLTNLFRSLFMNFFNQDSFLQVFFSCCHSYMWDCY